MLKRVRMQLGRNSNGKKSGGPAGRRSARRRPVRPSHKTRRRRTASCAELTSPREQIAAASRPVVSAAASSRSAPGLVAAATVGGAVDAFSRRVETWNILLARASTRLEVRLPHLASDFCCADSSRKPAASVRRALPNLTAADVGLHVDRRRPNHMILTATRFACLCRQHSQQQQHHG